jgi:hypothetical protein
MYARIVIGAIALDQLESFIHFWRGSILPSVQQQKGFRGVRLLVDRQTGKIVTSGVWETQADLLATVAWNQAQVEKVVSQFGAYFTTPPEIGLYEVEVDV